MFDFQLPNDCLDRTESYLRAVLANDSPRACHVIDHELSLGTPVRDLQLRLIAPAQHEIGRLWQENLITVAQEHLATSISQLALSRLYPHLPRERVNGLSAVVACVPGERHDLGARMGADFLEMVGFDVRFLGADVSLQTLLEAIEQDRPALLGLSATLAFHLPALQDVIAKVRTVAPLLPIVVGGGGLEAAPGLAHQLGVQAFGTSAEVLAQTCRDLLEESMQRTGGPETA
jgi:MerR family transcriptional regulator, light-induced transcriptional regulator